jgi:hypothetical protein
VVGFSEDGCIISAYQFLWLKEFVSFVDKKGATMVFKTTTMEVMGILLHMVSNIELIQNRVMIDFFKLITWPGITVGKTNMSRKMKWPQLYSELLISWGQSTIVIFMSSMFHGYCHGRLKWWTGCPDSLLHRPLTENLSVLLVL